MQEILVMSLMIVPSISMAILLAGAVVFIGSLAPRHRCKILSGAIGMAAGAAAVASVI